VLLQRSFTNYRRDRRASYVLVARLTFCSLLPLLLCSFGRVALSIVIGILMGLIFLRLKHDQVSAQVRLGNELVLNLCHRRAALVSSSHLLCLPVS
jgi:hypothetical protein